MAFPCVQCSTNNQHCSVSQQKPTAQSAVKELSILSEYKELKSAFAPHNALTTNPHFHSRHRSKYLKNQEMLAEQTVVLHGVHLSLFFPEIVRNRKQDSVQFEKEAR